MVTHDTSLKYFASRVVHCTSRARNSQAILPSFHLAVLHARSHRRQNSAHRVNRAKCSAKIVPRARAKGRRARREPRGGWFVLRLCLGCDCLARARIARHCRTGRVTVALQPHDATLVPGGSRKLRDRTFSCGARSRHRCARAIALLVSSLRRRAGCNRLCHKRRRGFVIIANYCRIFISA